MLEFELSSLITCPRTIAVILPTHFYAQYTTTQLHLYIHLLATYVHMNKFSFIQIFNQPIMLWQCNGYRYL